MIKNTLAAAVALFGIIVLVALSPVSASNASFAASSGYLPDQVANQAKEVLPAIDEYGDTGLSKSFPVESVDPAGWIDAAPQMYN